MSRFRHSSRALRSNTGKAIAPRCRPFSKAAKVKAQVRSCKTRLSRKTGPLAALPRPLQLPRLPQPQPQPPQQLQQPRPPTCEAGVVVRGTSGVLSCKAWPRGSPAKYTVAAPPRPLPLVVWKREVAQAKASSSFRKRVAAKLELEGMDRVHADAVEELQAIGARLRDIAPRAALRKAHGGGDPEVGSEEAELFDAKRMLTALVAVSSGFKSRRLEQEARQLVVEATARARTARAERSCREREALGTSKRTLAEAQQTPGDSLCSKQTNTESLEERRSATPSMIAAGGC